jgi:L,D-peptidoglycan transpeptidase YkuD (ErfK/YbiS/YcfS/YnhG family)
MPAMRSHRAVPTALAVAALTQAFGIAANPGTRLPYFTVDNDDRWVSDQHSPYGVGYHAYLPAPRRS